MPENLALYAIGGLAASEATGITNFTEIGGVGDDPEDSPFPPGGGGIPAGFGEAFGSMAEALAQTTGNVGGGVDTSGLSSIIAGQQEQIAALTANAGSSDGLSNTALLAEINRLRDRINERTPSPDGSGGGVGGIDYEGWGINVDTGGDSPGPTVSADSDPLYWESGWDIARNPGTWSAQQKEEFPTVIGTPGRGAADSGGIMGFAYDAGQATRGGWDTYTDAFDSWRGRYNEASEPYREAGERIKPSNWDIEAPDLSGISPVGTVSASPDSETEGTTSSSPGRRTEAEIDTGGLTLGSGESRPGGILSRDEPEEKREEPADTGDSRFNMGLVQ